VRLFVIFVVGMWSLVLALIVGFVWRQRRVKREALTYLDLQRRLNHEFKDVSKKRN